MTGMKSSKMSPWVLNTHGMGWMGARFNKPIYTNKLSKAKHSM